MFYCAPDIGTETYARIAFTSTTFRSKDMEGLIQMCTNVRSRGAGRPWTRCCEVLCRSRGLLGDRGDQGVKALPALEGDRASRAQWAPAWPPGEQAKGVSRARLAARRAGRHWRQGPGRARR